MERQVSGTTLPSPPVVNESRLRVRYAETDQMGFVYHANHFVWFEVGRVELLRQLGFSYREMEQQDHCHLAVVEASCRYRAPARYDEEIIVRTSIKNIRRSVVHFAYRLLRAGNGELIAEGETRHFAINAENKVAILPEKYRKALRQAMGK